MLVFIPMAIGQNLPISVRKSIEGQTEPCSIIEMHRPGVVDSQGSSSKEKVAGVCRSRQACVDAALQLPGYNEYVVVQDSDIQHLYDINIAAMKAFLDCNHGWAAVSLYWNNKAELHLEQPHIRQTCVMFRRELLSLVVYDEHTVRGCTCHCVTIPLRVAGYRVGYLDSYARVVEVVRT